jgi:subtilase family serine protease
VSLGTRSVPSLSASTSDSGSAVVIIPATTSGGTYYVIAKADGTDSVAESVESNNTKASGAMKIGADLIVSLATLAPSGAGASIVITDTTRNQGAGGADPTSTGFYLSSNSAHDASDLFLGSRPVPALAPNATNAISTTLQIPASTPTATYYVIAKADVASGVAETNESNNTAASSIRIGPDLVVSAIAVPLTAVSGTAISVTDTTRNDGGGSATTSTTRFYLSTNTAFDAGDTLLGSRPVGVLGAGAGSPGSTVVTIPAGLPTATFYIFAVADGDAQLVETLENNNTRAASVRVTAAP